MKSPVQLTRRSIIQGISLSAFATAFAAVAETAPRDAYLDIRDYGAVGDGVSDDNPAFERCCQAAAAAGKGVWIPPGTYVVGKAEGFILPCDLRGGAPDTCTFVINSSVVFHEKVFVVATDNRRISGLTLRCDGIAFDGGKEDAGSALIAVTAKDVSLRSLALRGSARCFIRGMSGCDGLEVSDVSIATTAAGIRGIFVGGDNAAIARVTLDAITVEGATAGSRNLLSGHSLVLEGCRDSKISRSTVYGGGSGHCFGICFDRCSTTEAVGNRIHDTAYEAINITNSTAITLSGNICTWTQDGNATVFGKDFGLSTDGCTDSKIMNNTLAGAYKSGIGCAAAAGNSARNLFSGNILIDCALQNQDVRSAVVLYAAHNFSNTHNTFVDNVTKNSDGRSTQYDYYELVYGTGHVGLNRVSSHASPSRPPRYKIAPTTTISEKTDPA